MANHTKKVDPPVSEIRCRGFIEEEERESLNPDGIQTLHLCDYHWSPTKLIE